MNTIRYRVVNVEYVKKSTFLTTAKTTFKEEGFAPFYRGFSPLFIGLCLRLISVYKPLNNHDLTLKDLIHLIPLDFLNYLFVHPFFLLSARVQYCPMYKTMQERAAYSNSYFALEHILKTEGVKGLYRGFVPGYMMQLAIHYSLIVFSTLNI